MRDFSFNSQSFLSEMYNVVGRKRQHQFLTTSALDNPKLQRDWENSFIITDKSLKNLVVLGILSWFIPEEYGILLRMDIKEIIKYNEDMIPIEFLIVSKQHCELYLCDTNLWHTRDFFGNILTEENILHALNSIRFRLRNRRKPTRLIRRRGYKDKGSRRSDVNPNAFIDTSSLVRDEELRRQSYQDTLAFLQAFLE